MNWKVPLMWEGGDVWIIGGGPSVPEQFGVPSKIIQKVIEGTSPPSAYSPFMEAIHNEHVIAINMSFLIGDWIDMLFFGDHGYFLANREKIAAFPGLKISCDPKSSKYNWVKFLARDAKHNKGISNNPTMVSWNGNSGAAAISVAANAGAKRIILLGFDMKLSNNKFQHWHDLYNRGAALDSKRIRKLPFDRHVRCFKPVADDARRRGIEILNACPDSAIPDFPKFSVKQLLYDNT